MRSYRTSHPNPKTMIYRLSWTKRFSKIWDASILTNIFEKAAISSLLRDNLSTFRCEFPILHNFSSSSNRLLQPVSVDEQHSKSLEYYGLLAHHLHQLLLRLSPHCNNLWERYSGFLVLSFCNYFRYKRIFPWKCCKKISIFDRFHRCDHTRRRWLEPRNSWSSFGWK